MLADHLSGSWLQTESPGSYIKIADITNFPVSTDLCGALVKLAKGGGMRELHWCAQSPLHVHVLSATMGSH